MGSRPASVPATTRSRSISARADGALPQAERLWGELRASLGDHAFTVDERPVAEIVLDLARARGAHAGHRRVVHGRHGGGRADRPSRQLRGVRGRRGHLLQPAQARAAGGARRPARPAWCRQRRGGRGDGARRPRSGSRPGRRWRSPAWPAPAAAASEKPVGLVYLHVSAAWGERRREMRWGGARVDVRQRATVAALHLMREHLATEP